MTTPAAARLYEAQHLAEMEYKGYAVFNPHGKPIAGLPVIYGFNNGGSPDWYSAVLLAEDGTGLGGHVCSSEGYMPHDLGVLEGTRPDRHESFREHYPDGYRMDFVSATDVRSHAGLMAAFALNQEKAKAAEQASAGEAGTATDSEAGVAEGEHATAAQAAGRPDTATIRQGEEEI